MSQSRRPASIDTAYHGRLFRSRIEARWAVFLNALGVAWEYERQGYPLRSGPYLPDFWLPRQEAWLEIKGEPPSAREASLARELAGHTGAAVYLFFGDVDAAVRGLNDGGYVYRPDGTRGDHRLWHECPRCQTVRIAPRGTATHLCAFPLGPGAPGADPARPELLESWTPRLQTAYERATRARFEHGQTPGAPGGPRRRGPDRPPARVAASKPVATDGPAGGAPDRVLEGVIRRWRGDAAREWSLPAYVIFPDRVLEELVRRRPRSLAALGDIRGLGPAKVERYGPGLLARMWERPAAASASTFTSPSEPAAPPRVPSVTSAPAPAPAPEEPLAYAAHPQAVAGDPWWRRVTRRLGGR